MFCPQDLTCSTFGLKDVFFPVLRSRSRWSLEDPRIKKNLLYETYFLWYAYCYIVLFSFKWQNMAGAGAGAGAGAEIMDKGGSATLFFFHKTSA